MGPSIPRRHHAPQVYRVRRAIAATAVLLVVTLGWKAVGPSGGGGKEATAPTSSTTATTLPPPPSCTATPEEGVKQNPDTDWATVLLDKQRGLSPTYAPKFVNIADAGFPLTDGVTVRSLVIPDLRHLREDAAAAGFPIKVIVGFRSYAYQQDLLSRRTTQLGASEVGSRVAKPGHSEHQLGTTVDLTSAALLDVNDTWGTTDTGQWVASHAFNYGFVLSYPPGRSADTCYDYEPWHFRYVGCPMAAEVTASKLTLREYLWKLEVTGAAPPARQDCATVAPTTTSTVAASSSSTAGSGTSSTTSTTKGNG